MRKWEIIECGSGTRRRPIERDYAAAKDAAFDKLRRGKVGKELQIWGNGFRCLANNLCDLRVLCGEILLENGN
jgi:hypothetical protein